VAATPTNITDAQALKHVCQNQGMVILDKGYDTKDAEKVAKIKGCHFRAIKKNNQKDKNDKRNAIFTAKNILRLQYYHQAAAYLISSPPKSPS